MKIQYPGVTDNIDSDIRNWIGILAVFPKGMYMDNLMEVARSELAWKCDYVWGDDYMRQFQAVYDSYGSICNYLLLNIFSRSIYVDDPVFVTQNVVAKLLSKRGITTEYVHGEAFDKAWTLDQYSHDFVRIYKSLYLEAGL